MQITDLNNIIINAGVVNNDCRYMHDFVYYLAQPRGEDVPFVLVTPAARSLLLSQSCL